MKNKTNKKKVIKVVIKGTQYIVEIVDNLYVGCVGETDTYNKTIVLVNDKDKEELQRSIIHELAHAYLYECGLIEFCHNENYVKWIEHTFFDIYNDFADIYNFISGKNE
ncbi:MAG: hypothetical protein IJ542_00640 [Clostridia bacterium]|nr:hypothetical protein [Clostridia bacterium]